MTIREIVGDKGAICERLMRALPDWFGIEQALVDIARESEGFPVWVAEEEGEVVGCVALKRHNEFTAEVWLLAVLPTHHRRGIGRALHEALELRARADGHAFLTVKTLGPSHPDESYARTRQFYTAIGFRPLEEFKALWGDQPCLMLAKALR